MCGIAGAWGHQAAFAIDPMTQALAHRGPDGSGSWKAPDIPLFLGHRRLSILDHEGGIQPMHDASTGMTITFNGEIYNHAELRHTLIQKGHSFTSSHSDTEVILKAYAEWGPEMVHKFNGMWAFAIYDLNTKRIFISRDRFGQNLYIMPEAKTGLLFHLNSSHSLSTPGSIALYLKKP
jgi:asparagine synthase (glutamine-hydrolysing)